MATVDELADMFMLGRRDIEADLGHLFKSLRRTPYRVNIEPAHCRKCGFRFGRDKLSKPGKCPECRSTWIAPPRFGLEHEGCP